MNLLWTLRKASTIMLKNHELYGTSPVLFLLKSAADLYSHYYPQDDKDLFPVPTIYKSSTTLAYLVPALQDLFDKRQTLRFDVQYEMFSSNCGSLIFARSYSGHLIPDFHFETPGFDFTNLYSNLWLKHQNAIHLDINSSPAFRVQLKGLPQNKQVLLGSTRSLLSAFCERHRAFQKKGSTSRGHLLLGNPGTGKTTFCQLFAKQSNSRLLCVSSHCLAHDQYLLDIILQINPDVLLFDDFDRHLVAGKIDASVLNFFDNLRLTCPGITLFLNVNSTTELPDAILRPGRVDEVIHFAEPTEEDRREILCGYLTNLHVEYTAKDLEDLLKATKGYTPAYLKETVEQARATSVEFAVTSLKQRSELLARYRK